MFLFLFHVNTCSLMKSFNDLQYLISYTNNNSYMVAISETRITKQVFLLVMSNLNNCSKEFCPAETSGNFILLYIHNNLLHKCKTQLNI